jgi:alkylation response protein AidB-like acyl-CoA dehydrogenase
MSTADRMEAVETRESTPLLSDASCVQPLVDWLRSYAARKINSRLIDERRCVSPQVILDFARHGLFGLMAPKTVGGLGLGHRDYVRVVEQLGAIDLTLAAMVGIHNGLGLRPIINSGTQMLRETLVPQLAQGRGLAAFALSEPGAGSNPLALASRAVRSTNGWLLYGEKMWIGLASWAEVIVVVANAFNETNTFLGPTAFAVMTGADGLTIGPEALTMGVRGIVQNRVSLDGVFVPDSHTLGEIGKGLDVAKNAMHFTRFGLAAVSIGAMKRCSQIMQLYASRRRLATGMHRENPVTRDRLQTICCSINALEQLVTIMASRLDAALVVPEEFYLCCKVLGPELLWTTVDWTMQALGGRGYVENNAVPQLFRDARLLRIFEGPTETMQSHLGTLVLRGKSAFGVFMCEWFSAQDIVQSLNETCAKCSSSQESVAQTTAGKTSFSQHCAYQIGEAAAFGVLYAAVRAQQNILSTANRQASIDWARNRFEAATRHALEMAGNAHHVWTSQEVAAVVDTYGLSIGTIEQGAAGEELELDELLRLNPSPHGAGFETPIDRTI